jgi:phage tail-like protein
MNQPTLLMASNFAINLKLDNSNDFLDGTFRECDSFDFTQEVIQFREVIGVRWGEALKGRSLLTKIPANAVGGNLTLRRGMNISKSLWEWFASVQDGKWFEKRRKMSVTFNQGDSLAAVFEFTGAWPTRYRIGEMKADASNVEIEEVEIAYEEFNRVSA